MQERYKWAFSLLAGAVVNFAKQYNTIIICVAAVVIFDFVTGMIASKVTGKGIESKIAAVGFWKKMALFAALFFGFFMDFFIPYMLSCINIEIPVSALFGLIFGCYIVINESISIAENLYRCNPDILPAWVIKLLTGVKEQLNDEEEVKNDGNENE